MMWNQTTYADLYSSSKELYLLMKQHGGGESEITEEDKLLTRHVCLILFQHLITLPQIKKSLKLHLNVIDALKVLATKRLTETELRNLTILDVVPGLITTEYVLDFLKVYVRNNSYNIVIPRNYTDEGWSQYN